MKGSGCVSAEVLLQHLSKRTE